MLNPIKSTFGLVGQVWHLLTGVARADYDPLATALLRNLAENNGFSQWPGDRPREWEVVEDLRWNNGVQWFTGLVEHLRGLNLCQQDLHGVVDLSGLESLERLYLSRNNLDALILNDNTHLRELHLDGNRLVRLDLSGAPSLVELEVTGNQVTTLNVARNRELVTLCIGDNRLMDLDLSGAAKLRRLVADTNQLCELDLSRCSDLTYLAVYENRLTDLSLRSCPRLETLSVADNPLQSGLDFSQNPELAYANLYNTGLEELDLSHNPRLWYLVASGNHLSSLDLSIQTALSHLVVSGNALDRLDVSQSPDLRTLDAGDNQIETLDVSRNQNLWYIYAALNQLTRLDISANSQLLILDLTQNQIQEINLRQNARLQRLYVTANRLRRLDVSRNELLERLYANDNPLEEAVFGRNRLTALREVDLSDCRLPLSALLPWVGRGADLTLLGPQHRVLFEHLTFEAGQLAVVDLTAEAVLHDAATEFTVLDAQKQPVPPQAAKIEDGRVTFRQKGRYQIMMTNPHVVSSSSGQLEPVLAFTGWIDRL